MADTKISALSAGTALAGTEVFPGVQGGATVKFTAAQLATFVWDSPTLVTPILGVATGTSLALGGATIGAHALAVAGTVIVSNAITSVGGTSNFINVSASSAGQFLWSTRTRLSSPADASLQVLNNAQTNSFILTAPAATATPTFQLGAADLASGAVAQTITFQGNTGATTTGPLALIKGALGGSGAGSIGGEVRIQGGLSGEAAGTGGAISFYTAGAGSGTTPAVALSLAANKTATFSGAAQLANLNTLPTPVAGMMAYVTDATAPAVGIALTQGGAAFAAVIYNGTQWTVFGI